jgi:hypothetical protein
LPFKVPSLVSVTHIITRLLTGENTEKRGNPEGKAPFSKLPQSQRGGAGIYACGQIAKNSGLQPLKQNKPGLYQPYRPG